MKHLTYILSLYILVLTVIPCIDVHQVGTLQKIEQAGTASNNHSAEKDHCSPFCTCQCCASPIVFNAFAVDFKRFEYSQKYHSEYASDSISSPSASIWQPPKISFVTI